MSIKHGTNRFYPWVNPASGGGGGACNCTISTPGPCDADVTIGKVGNDLQFKGIDAGPGVSILDTGTCIEISATGAATAALLAVANVGVLAALDDAPLDDGSVVGMLSVLDTWTLIKTAASPAADGITVIVPLSGAGRWVRSQRSNPFWRSQTTWHIDQGAGDDENDGLTAVDALASHEEFQRRVADSSHPIEVVMTVTFDANYTGNIENKAPVSQISPFGQITYLGTRTTLFSGSFTAVTPWATTTTAGTMTDAALPVSWAASGGLEKLCVLTSGPNAGSASWITLETVAKTARYSGFFNETTFATHDPGVAETYDVVDLTVINGRIVQDVAGYAVFKNLRIAPVGGFEIGVQIFFGSAALTYCDVDVNNMFFGYDNGFPHSVNGCRIQCATGGMRTFNCALSLYTSWFRANGLTAGAGSIISLWSRSMGQKEAGGPNIEKSIGAEASGTVRVRDGGEYCLLDVANATERAIRIELHGNATIYPTGVVWGLNNTISYGAEIEAAGTIVYPAPASAHFSFAAITADFLVGGISVNVAGLPVVDLTKGAFAVES